MSARINYPQLSPESYKALLALDKTLGETSLDKTLVELVKIRVSQINGCLFCADMHIKESRTHGERELRLHHLVVWHESPLFTDKEKAALDWAERVTKLDPSKGIEEHVFKKARETFSEKELSDLTFVIGNMNIWNRFGVAFVPEPGSLDKLFGLDKIGLV